jgi:hypothetical protein
VFVSTHYAEHELQPWLEQKLFWALNDHAFEQAAVIAKFSKEKIFLEITDYIGIFTEDLVIFLESHTSIIGIKPFIQIEWTNNKAGVEGFARLVKLVDPEAMKDFISRRSPEGRDYPPLAMLLQEGKMEGYFDNKTRELIIARSYVYSLSSAFSENQTALILQDMEPERLLYLLAVEAKQPDDTSDFLRALSNTAAWVKSKLKA